ncbi:MAG TPA: type II toxin-antitoxin system antitoxin SocA domain-containing protein [Longimicrobium sp.]
MDKKHRKLAELILYISDRHETDEWYGSTRLAKTLFYADFLFYAKHGRSITQERYVRKPNGPMPDSMLNVRDRMVQDKDLVVKVRDHLVH